MQFLCVLPCSGSRVYQCTCIMFGKRVFASTNWLEDLRNRFQGWNATWCNSAPQYNNNLFARPISLQLENGACVSVQHRLVCAQPRAGCKHGDGPRRTEAATCSTPIGDQPWPNDICSCHPVVVSNVTYLPKWKKNARVCLYTGEPHRYAMIRTVIGPVIKRYSGAAEPRDADAAYIRAPAACVVHNEPPAPRNGIYVPVAWRDDGRACNFDDGDLSSSFVRSGVIKSSNCVSPQLGIISLAFRFQYAII